MECFSLFLGFLFSLHVKGELEMERGRVEKMKSKNVHHQGEGTGRPVFLSGDRGMLRSSGDHPRRSIQKLSPEKYGGE